MSLFYYPSLMHVLMQEVILRSANEMSRNSVNLCPLRFNHKEVISQPGGERVIFVFQEM